MIRSMRHFTFFTAAFVLFCFATTAFADCTLIARAESKKILVNKGDCTVRHSPASTFKIPLALMGFDSGVLVDAHTPQLPYKDEYNASLESWRHDTDPTSWEKESVVWYSQELTKKLGMKKFKAYVARLSYGNQDLRGDKGKNNGLTNAWLGSSLQISPFEQTLFLRKLLNRKFALSDQAYAMTEAVIPVFAADGGWEVHGKTGSAVKIDKKGKTPFGWFVGWADKGGKRVVFARYVEDKQPMDTPAGPRVRESFLRDLPTLSEKF